MIVSGTVPDDDRACFAAMLEQERQTIEQLTAGWDDPTQVDWGAEESNEATPDTVIDNTSETTVTYKCTALYSYTVNILF